MPKPNKETLNIRLVVTRRAVKQVAGVLAAKAAGNGYPAEDDDEANSILSKIVCQAAVVHGVKSHAVTAVFCQAHADYKPRRRA